ncbi:hypothetical protein DFH94DRAFT_685509 [Russula ochroleuca]|uniref:Uncharacterized protein n=1 Tax=Russula ochroleuca TaxID=152965 RepID=A0A9P5MJW6_9AGAM|nr:hypothetical protein DFH94DRAFT_687146 [Russula ochroleuca]KAF8468698.1 hypothetical protein DFH94DRAFT_685509 [Russula ochroleuca]
MSESAYPSMGVEGSGSGSGSGDLDVMVKGDAKKSIGVDDSDQALLLYVLFIRSSAFNSIVQPPRPPTSRRFQFQMPPWRGPRGMLQIWGATSNSWDETTTTV